MNIGQKMKIRPEEISIKEIAKGYRDDTDKQGPIVGYGGKLNIRPLYQRNFVYDDDKQIAVINSILNDYPINLIYWIDNGDGTFELLDGQQRIISICKYVKNKFAISPNKNPKFFDNLSTEEQDQILNYPLTIYHCTGGDRTEKTKWFEVINTAGDKLNKQEILNAIYHGDFITEAKRWFSRKNCPAGRLARKYVAGEVNRQKFLETAIKWKSKDKIEKYMAKNQNKKEEGTELWEYFETVINWVKNTFPTPRTSLMQQVHWGELHDKYEDDDLDPEQLEKQIATLLKDKEVTKKAGVYAYLLTGEKKHLNLRKFGEEDKIEMFEKQNGKCPRCENKFPIEKMEADHITPWIDGGKTIIENCQVLCKNCNRKKGAR